MKTILSKTAPGKAFKQVWPLPGLNGSLLLDPGGAAAIRPAGIPPPLAVPRCATDAARGVALAGPPVTREGAAEGMVLGLLALAAATGIVQAFAIPIKLAANWESFCVWVAKLIG